MSIGNINKNNFDWRSQLIQMADINKKHTQQAQQSPGSVLQEAENIIKDSVEISADSRQMARTPIDEQAEMASRYQEMLDQLEKAREQGDAMADSMRLRMKCLLIAMRIMSGDEVPVQDYRYLAKNDLELYAKAVSMRVEKENPKKHKRVSEDEKSGGNDGASETADSAGAAGAESVQAESGEVSAEAGADSPESSETPS